MHENDLIVGVGSPHGDDAVGWRVVEQLQQTSGAAVRVIKLQQPMELLEHLKIGPLKRCRRLWLVDACCSDQMPGTFTRIVWPDVPPVFARSLSSHGLGVVPTLQWAASLGRLPSRVVIYAIAVAGVELAESTSTVISGKIPDIARRLMEDLGCCR